MNGFADFAPEKSPLLHRLVYRYTRPVGVINVIQVQQRYQQLIAWLQQRFQFVDQLTQRAAIEASEESNAQAMVFQTPAKSIGYLQSNDEPNINRVDSNQINRSPLEPSTKALSSAASFVRLRQITPELPNSRIRPRVQGQINSQYLYLPPPIIENQSGSVQAHLPPSHRFQQETNGMVKKRLAENKSSPQAVSENYLMEPPVWRVRKANKENPLSINSAISSPVIYDQARPSNTPREALPSSEKKNEPIEDQTGRFDNCAPFMEETDCHLHLTVLPNPETRFRSQGQKISSKIPILTSIAENQTGNPQTLDTPGHQFKTETNAAINKKLAGNENALHTESEPQITQPPIWRIPKANKENPLPLILKKQQTAKDQNSPANYSTNLIKTDENYLNKKAGQFLPAVVKIHSQSNSDDSPKLFLRSTSSAVSHLDKLYWQKRGKNNKLRTQLGLFQDKIVQHQIYNDSYAKKYNSTSITQKKEKQQMVLISRDSFSSLHTFPTGLKHSVLPLLHSNDISTRMDFNKLTWRKASSSSKSSNPQPVAQNENTVSQTDTKPKPAAETTPSQQHIRHELSKREWNQIIEQVTLMVWKKLSADFDRRGIRLWR